jgi:RNA polymerase sigma factor (sigma-70 family)
MATDWAGLYRRLARDRNDQHGWDTLEASVRAWAQQDLWQRGWTVVDDAVAESCADVVLGLEKARGPETFAGFVRGQYLNVRRRVLQRLRLPVTSLPQLDPPALDDGVLDERRWRALDDCLAMLPTRDREAVRLRYFAQATAERIAAALGVRPGNARRIVFNGVARLRRCLQLRGVAG